MRGFLKAALLVVGMMLALVHGAMAFNVSGIVTDPSGPVTPGTPMTVTGTIHPDLSSGKAVACSDALQLTTDLETADWNYTLVIDGRENPQPHTAGKSLSISGWLLSSPGTADESVRFTLSGITPSVARTKNITLTRIQETDNQGNPVTGTLYEYHTVVVNVGPPSPVNQKNSILMVFRSHIDEKGLLGINTSAAEVKYAEADALIKSAAGRPSTQYVLAHQDLDAAQKAIDDGEILLDKAWAEKEVADAEVSISNIDQVIGWVKGNSSTADDPVLSRIITKREIATSYLTTAKDEIVNGNYEEARRKAHEASYRANESEIAGDRFDYIRTENPFPLYGIIFMSVIILIIAGILWWRRQKRWSLE